MKNLAKLALFFSLSFIIIFLAATGIRYLSLRVEWVRNLPQTPETFFTIVISAANWAHSLAMYASILLTLSYAGRRQYFAPLTVIFVMILSLGFNFGVSFALYHWKSVPPVQTSVKKLGENGLILSNAQGRDEIAVVLLKGTAEPLGPRVTAIPDRPLFFQESTAYSNINLPLIPFGGDSPEFIKNLSTDIKLGGEQLQKRFAEGYIPYLIYAGSLVFLLSSLGLAIKFSVWPLANIFLGALAFRGILAVEIFFNSSEMQYIFDSFLENLLPSAMAIPLIFLGFGVLVHTYSILIFVSRRRDDDDD